MVPCRMSSLLLLTPCVGTQTPLETRSQSTKTWTGAVIDLGADGSLYAFSLLVPTINSELGSGLLLSLEGTELTCL